MAEELIPAEDPVPDLPDDADETKASRRKRTAVVHVSLLPRAMLSVDDPDLIDW